MRTSVRNVISESTHWARGISSPPLEVVPQRCHGSHLGARWITLPFLQNVHSVPSFVLEHGLQPSLLLGTAAAHLPVRLGSSKRMSAAANVRYPPGSV